METKVNGQLSQDKKYLYLSKDVRFVLEAEFYKQRRFGELGLMPKDIIISHENQGIEKIVSENLGIEKFGSFTIQSKEGNIGKVDLNFVSKIILGQNNYILRHTQYKKGDLFVLYSKNKDKTNLVGLGVVNFQEEYVAKFLGLGIKDELQKKGHGTAFLAAVEKECARTNMLLMLHNPLRQIIPFYVKRGYRYLEHPNGPDFAKALNPGFDESVLIDGLK